MLIQYYTIKEIADKLRVTPQCVAGWIKNKGLVAEKIGNTVRIPVEEWNKFRHAQLSKNKKGA